MAKERVVEKMEGMAKERMLEKMEGMAEEGMVEKMAVGAEVCAVMVARVEEATVDAAEAVQAMEFVDEHRH